MCEITGPNNRMLVKPITDNIKQAVRADFNQLFATPPVEGSATPTFYMYDAGLITDKHRVVRMQYKGNETATLDKLFNQHMCALDYGDNGSGGLGSGSIGKCFECTVGLFKNGDEIVVALEKIDGTVGALDNPGIKEIQNYCKSRFGLDVVPVQVLTDETGAIKCIRTEGFEDNGASIPPPTPPTEPIKPPTPPTEPIKPPTPPTEPIKPPTPPTEPIKPPTPPPQPNQLKLIVHPREILKSIAAAEPELLTSILDSILDKEAVYKEAINIFHLNPNIHYPYLYLNETGTNWLNNPTMYPPPDSFKNDSLKAIFRDGVLKFIQYYTKQDNYIINDPIDNSIIEDTTKSDLDKIKEYLNRLKYIQEDDFNRLTEDNKNAYRLLTKRVFFYKDDDRLEDTIENRKGTFARLFSIINRPRDSPLDIAQLKTLASTELSSEILREYTDNAVYDIPNIIDFLALVYGPNNRLYDTIYNIYNADRPYVRYLSKEADKIASVKAAVVLGLNNNIIDYNGKYEDNLYTLPQLGGTCYADSLWQVFRNMSHIYGENAVVRLTDNQDDTLPEVILRFLRPTLHITNFDDNAGFKNIYGQVMNTVFEVCDIKGPSNWQSGASLIDRLILINKQFSQKLNRFVGILTSGDSDITLLEHKQYLNVGVHNTPPVYNTINDIPPDNYMNYYNFCNKYLLMSVNRTALGRAGANKINDIGAPFTINTPYTYKITSVVAEFAAGGTHFKTYNKVGENWHELDDFDWGRKQYISPSLTQAAAQAKINDRGIVIILLERDDTVEPRPQTDDEIHGMFTTFKITMNSYNIATDDEKQLMVSQSKQLLKLTGRTDLTEANVTEAFNTFKGDPNNYPYRIARNIILESLGSTKTQPPPTPQQQPSIEIDGQKFQLVGVANIPGDERLYLRLNNITDPNNIIELTAYRSLSEGLWRLLFSGLKQHLYKGGHHYITETFIHIELQGFIEKHLAKLPKINESDIVQIGDNRKLYREYLNSVDDRVDENPLFEVINLFKHLDVTIKWFRGGNRSYLVNLNHLKQKNKYAQEFYDILVAIVKSTPREDTFTLSQNKTIKTIKREPEKTFTEDIKYLEYNTVWNEEIIKAISEYLAKYYNSNGISKYLYTFICHPETQETTYGKPIEVDVFENSITLKDEFKSEISQEYHSYKLIYGKYKLQGKAKIDKFKLRQFTYYNINSSDEELVVEQEYNDTYKIILNLIPAQATITNTAVYSKFTTTGIYTYKIFDYIGDIFSRQCTGNAINCRFGGQVYRLIGPTLSKLWPLEQLTEPNAPEPPPEPKIIETIIEEAESTACPELSDHEIQTILEQTNEQTKETLTSAINLLEGLLLCNPVDSKIVNDVIVKISTINRALFDDIIKVRLRGIMESPSASTIDFAALRPILEPPKGGRKRTLRVGRKRRSTRK